MGAKACFVKLFTFIINTASRIYKCAAEGKHNTKSTTNNEIAEQATYLCEKYIQNRFQRSWNNTNNKFYKTAVLRDTKLCSKEVVSTLCDVGRMMENAYPALYQNISEQLNFRINLEIVVCGMFTCVCDNILASGITWARVVSLYAFAAALAVDCCQTDVRIAKNISKWMGQYTKKRLSGWVRENGGWEALPLHFCEEKYCMFISASRFLRSIALPLYLGVFAALAVVITIWSSPE